MKPLHAVAALLLPGLAYANWHTHADVDPFTNETLHIATMSYDEGLNTRSLVVRCKDGGLGTIVSFDDFLDTDPIDVRYRIDNNALVSDRWNPSARGTDVIADNPHQLARELMAGDSLVIEALDSRGVVHRATFDLNGSKAAIDPVLTACDVASESLSNANPELRQDTINALEKWGPKKISTGKEILRDMNRFDGAIDEELTPRFALALQNLSDQYHDDCRAGRHDDVNCRLARTVWKTDDSYLVPHSSVLYELSSGDTHDRFGKLKRAD